MHQEDFDSLAETIGQKMMDDKERVVYVNSRVSITKVDLVRICHELITQYYVCFDRQGEAFKDDFVMLTPEQANQYFGPALSVQTWYHYTSIEALINGIIVSKPEMGREISLRVTHNQYMNDPTEFVIGENLLKEVTEQLQKKCSTLGQSLYIPKTDFRESFFFTCFSENSDSLPMWNMYGNNGQGVALEFDRGIPEVSNEYLLKCEYDVSNVVPRFSELLKENRDAAIQYLVMLPFMLKHPSYRHEKEIRYVGAFANLTTKYRHKNGLAIPYKEICMDKNMLKSVTIGPSANMEIVENSLRRFLDDRGFTHVMIKKSGIPYRL